MEDATPVLNYHFREIAPVLPETVLPSLHAAAECYGVYRTYGEERGRAPFAAGLAERYELLRHMRRAGGPFGRSRPGEAADAESHHERAAQSLFRGTYARGAEVLASGFEALLNHAGFRAAAAAVHDRPVVVPQVLFANLLVPGQQITNHTDVPAFRGVNRTSLPHWLLTVMHHSGLFEAWRVPITTVVAWFSDCAEGGAFAFYADGPDRAATVWPAAANRAIAIDSDSVFHRVEPVATGDGPVIPITVGMELHHVGEGAFAVVSGGRALATYPWQALRLSISLKLFGFRDSAEQAAFAAHRDDLTLPAILDRFERDLRERTLLAGPRPSDQAFADLLVDTYMRFPPPLL